MTIQQATGLINSALPFLAHLAEVQHWADLGCGSGLFTKALAGLLPAGSTVYGVDTQSQLSPFTFTNGTRIASIAADFVKDALLLRDLDGILMANSLHYVADKAHLLQRLEIYMRLSASFLIVEYDTDVPVPTWVPYPISYTSLQRQFGTSRRIEKLGERPSLYGRGNIYAALVMRGMD